MLGSRKGSRKVRRMEIGFGFVKHKEPANRMNTVCKLFAYMTFGVLLRLFKKQFRSKKAQFVVCAFRLTKLKRLVFVIS